MAEQVFHWGENGHLLAIWTPPVGPAHNLAVVLLNAGVIHHIGAHRAHVKLARELATRGYGCLRFDFSGLGDSRLSDSATDFKRQAMGDVNLVLDSLQQFLCVRQFALLGICSGAAHAQAAAVADERVRAVFLIDGFMFPSWRGRWHFARRMAAAYGWLPFAQRVLRFASKPLKAFVGRRNEQAPAFTEEDRSPTRSPAEFSADMQRLADRHVTVTMLYTGSVLETFSHEGQLHDVFERQTWLRHVQCILEPGVDHTLTLRRSQDLLLQRVIQWLDRVPRQGKA